MTDLTIEQPDEQPQEQPEAQSEEGFLETTLSMVYEPVVALRRVTANPNIAWAIAVSIVVSMASIVSSSAAPQPVTGTQFPTPPLAVQLIFFPIAGLFGLLLGTSLLHLSAKILGGKGPFTALFVGLAFAGVPTVFQIPAQLLGLALGGDQGLLLSGILNSAVAIWILVLGVIAIREAHSFTTGRAVGAFALTFVAMVVLFLIIVVAILALTFGTVAGLTGAGALI